MIFFVRLEVLGQVGDAFAQYCDLDFRGSRVGRMDTILRDDGSLRFLV